MSADHHAWLVDLDGTLYRVPVVACGLALELALLDRPAIRCLRRFVSEHDDMQRNGVVAPKDGGPFELQIRRTAKALHMTKSEVRACVDKWMFRRALKWIVAARRGGLLRQLAHYRAAGGRTALVSDYPARAKLRALGAVHLFDAVVANGEPGGPRRLKPSPEGYLLAAERIGVEPRRCVVVGDRDDADGAAARAAGMSFRLVR